MTDNFENHEPETHDEFTEPEIGLSAQSPRKSMGGIFVEAWRTRPLVKFVVLIVAIFAVGVAVVNFFGSNNNPEIARLGKPPNLKEAPGGESSIYMRQQTELANKERADQAMASGSSAMPTPTRENVDVGGFAGEDKKNDPLNELRAETERLQKQVQQQQVQQQQAQQHPEPFDNSLAEAMQRQMRQLMEGWSPKGIKTVSVISPTDEKNGEKGAGTDTAASQNTAPVEQPKAVVNAGTVSYAQLLTEANSDVPGPILAQIVSGPLNGARAIGAFQVADGYEKYLVLKFKLADRKGKDYKINAIALDPDTTLGGMATEVDERYFSRVVLPAAAAFLQGMGQALGQGNSATQTNGTVSLTTTTGNGFRQGMYNGLGQGAQTAGQFFQNQANLTKPLVRVAAGTPMGLFFVEPVFDPSTQQQVQQNQPIPVNGNGGYGNGGYGNGNYGSPYPGTTVGGFGGGNQNSGMPYPNYAQPGYGYGNSINHTMPMNGMNPTNSYLPAAQGFGQ